MQPEQNPVQPDPAAPSGPQGPQPGTPPDLSPAPQAGPIVMPQPVVSSPSPAAPAMPSSPQVTSSDVGTYPGGVPGNRKKLAVALVSVIIVLAAAFLVYKLVFNKPITAKDVSTARSSTDAVFNDVNDGSLAFSEAGNADTTSAAQSKLSVAQSKLDDAKKNYLIIKKSNVLHDAAVKQKFEALDAKWNPYVNFLQGGIDDSKALLPIIIKFDDDTQTLTQKSPSTRSALSTYLSRFKNTIDGTSTQLKSVNMKLGEDKQLVSDMQTFLSSSSQAVATAQHDLSAGKDIFTVEDDLFKIDDASTTFTTKADGIQSQLDDHEKKLDPSNELDGLETALDNLSFKVDSKK